MEAFEVVKTLGRGAFATVFLVRRKSDGQNFVIKKFHRSMSELDVKERAEVAQEIKVQAHLSHENIVKFVDRCVVTRASARRGRTAQLLKPAVHYRFRGTC